MKHQCVVLTVLLVVLASSGNLWALPTTPYEAEMVVTGWLKANPQPLGATLGQEVTAVETFTDEFGSPAYYIVYLYPSGFAIVSADDKIEPIIGFADDEIYDPASGKPLAALVTNDLNGRIAGVHSTPGLMAISPQIAVTESQKKWNYLIGQALTRSDAIKLMSRSPIRDSDPSDVRVAPIVRSKWGQTSYEDGSGQRQALYNYYTPPGESGDPNNYPSGCVATAMAQLMRYHEYPDVPIELKKVAVDVDSSSTSRWYLGGSGPDGAYDWDAMVLSPGGDITDEQRRAIGAICLDAGIASRTDYLSDGSGTTLERAAEGLMDIFLYGNAIRGDYYKQGFEHEDLITSINANLDAESPVILGIVDSTHAGAGHAVLCDGYGYNSSTLYHHLNMGWQGQEDCWYNLPSIKNSEGDGYDVIIQFIYNIFAHATGEIASGRITDTEDKPLADIVVIAQNEDGADSYTATTNSNGIYALQGIDSDSEYSVTANRFGYDFERNKMQTGESLTGDSAPGNVWGIDFVGYSNYVTVAIGTETLSWDYPMNTLFSQSRTQVIYLVDEIEAYGHITALALNVVVPSDEVMDNWTIRMKHTGLAEYSSDSLDAAGWTVVYRNSETVDSTGWRTFELQTPFEYNGTDNLLVDFSHNNASNAESPRCEVSKPGGARSVYAHSDNDHGNPSDWSGGVSPPVSSSDHVPNVKLTFGRESRVSRGDMKLTASDGRTDDQFGCSVAISGDYAIVGAYGYNQKHGAAYIFKRDGTNWTEQAKLQPERWDSEVGDCFGISVSISGNYAIVGAPYRGGAAFIFVREGTSWKQQQCLGASESRSFGFSTAISGDYAIVGVPQRGYAYIFKYEGTRWIEQVNLTASDSTNRNYFGGSVAISGEYAIAAGDDYGSNRYAGPVYIFERSGTNWTEQLRMTAPSGATADSFGDSVSISGYYIAVGAPQEDDDDNGTECGSAYILEHGGASWTQQVRLTAPGGDPWDHFGRSVSISGDYTIVGAPDDNDDNKGRDTGSAYMFKRDGTNWTSVARLTALDGAYDDHFGSAVAIDGDYVIIAAEGGDGNERNSGSAYIFKRTGSAWTP